MKIIKFVMLLFFCLSVFLSTSYAGQGIKWYSYKNGMIAREKNEKKVFIHFWTSWCGYCTKMEKKTFNDPRIIDYLNKNFIPIKVNAEKEKNIAVTYNVKGFPDNWFIAEKGKKIANQPGYLKPEKLLSILKYIYSDSYKNMDYNSFLKGGK